MVCFCCSLSPKTAGIPPSFISDGFVAVHTCFCGDCLVHVSIRGTIVTRQPTSVSSSSVFSEKKKAVEIEICFLSVRDVIDATAKALSLAPTLPTIATPTLWCDTYEAVYKPI